jgi:hypothetical protein
MQPRGFIAITSAIIIAAILLVIATSGSLASFFSRFNVLDFELKQRSQALAEACADTVLLNIAGDSAYPVGYAVPETVTVGSDTCTILGATNPSGSPRTFNVQAAYQSSYTNLAVTVDVNNLLITGWQEVPTL